jgi:hypothetical protein
LGILVVAPKCVLIIGYWWNIFTLHVTTIDMENMNKTKTKIPSSNSKVEQRVSPKNYNLGNTRHRNKTPQNNSLPSNRVTVVSVYNWELCMYRRNHIQDIHLIHKMFTEIQDGLGTYCTLSCIKPKFHVIAKAIITRLLILYYEKSFSQITLKMTENNLNEKERRTRCSES